MPLLQTEIEDMIWEVDEDCDQGLNWAEFQAMYHRCNNDKTGLYAHASGSLFTISLPSDLCRPRVGYEPRRLFNVVQFVMNDKEGSGNVSLEGAMQILYLRYGRGLLDAQLEEIFGTSDLNSGKLQQPCIGMLLQTLHRGRITLQAYTVSS